MGIVVKIVVGIVVITVVGIVVMNVVGIVVIIVVGTVVGIVVNIEVTIVSASTCQYAVVVPNFVKDRVQRIRFNGERLSDLYII